MVDGARKPRWVLATLPIRILKKKKKRCRLFTMVDKRVVLFLSPHHTTVSSEFPNGKDLVTVIHGIDQKVQGVPNSGLIGPVGTEGRKVR